MNSLFRHWLKEPPIRDILWATSRLKLPQSVNGSVQSSVKKQPKTSEDINFLAKLGQKPTKSFDNLPLYAQKWLVDMKKSHNGN